MGSRDWIAMLALASAFAAPGASAAVFKCKAGDGSLTYQELPCGSSEQTLRSDIAADYPAPNVAERERLLQREAALYQRLEAQRERLSAEAIARISRPDPQPIAAVEPWATVAWPAWSVARRWHGSHRPNTRNVTRDVSSGRLR